MMLIGDLLLNEAQIFTRNSTCWFPIKNNFVTCQTVGSPVIFKLVSAIHKMKINRPGYVIPREEKANSGRDNIKYLTLMLKWREMFSEPALCSIKWICTCS
jgi:hypothetical protein